MLCLLAWPGGAHAATVQSLEVAREGNGLTITLATDEEIKAKLFTLTNPDRVVLDLPRIEWEASRGVPENYKGKLLKGVRTGWFNPTTYRVVFELTAKASASLSSESDSLVISIEPSGKATSGKKSVAVEKKSKRKPIIVIDAGHGGVDPGTIGADGAYEKDITIAYAKALREELLRTGRYQVVLTRNDDTFILLRGRVELARQAKGDLFLSLHADSAPDDKARGLSLYTLSETASDKEAEALAARENKVDLIAGMDLSKESEDVAGILIDLAKRETNNKSSILAALMVKNVGRYVTLLPNTHRFAGFAVLKALDIPSALVEIGFLSNAKEEEQIKQRGYRSKVVQGLTLGIDEYFKVVGNERD